MLPVCVILGPTASGKSKVAHEVARLAGAVVLAVDSMTVYRGMDIGTAKPTLAERAEVTYRGLDLAEPTESFTVARWLTEAERVLAGNVPVVACGGTPLYYQALFRGLFDGPPADARLRAELEDVPEAALRERVAAVDPASAARIARNDTRRLIRVLEVYAATGEPLSDLQRQWDAGPDRYPSVRFGLSWDRPMLNRRINARARAMFDGGWVEEVRSLLSRHGSLSPTARDAAGYAAVARVVDGTLSPSEAVELVKIRTRQLARRQLTWFRRFENVTWLDGSVDGHAARIADAWRAASVADEQREARQARQA